MRKIPHRRQSDKQRNCGASCIAMLFQTYGKNGKLSEITQAISRIMPNGIPSCRNNLIAKYINDRGVPCCIVALNDICIALPKILQNDGIDVIIAYRPNVHSPEAHFSVVTGIDDKSVFVNDPQIDPPDGQNRPIPIVELQKQMAPLEGNNANEIVRANTVILLSNPEKEIEMSAHLDNVRVFDCILPMVTSVLIPDDADGHWRDVIQPPPPPL